MPRLDRSNPNALIGVILLVALAVFVLPNRLPQFLGELSPQLFTGIPCTRLPVAKDLAAHQSVLGRRAVDPLVLALTTDAIGESGELSMRLTVKNSSLGTVPVVFQEEDIVVAGAEDASNGFGLVIDPAPAAGARARSHPNIEGYDEGDIRLLGPRQRCAHSVMVTAAGAMIDAGGSARAWYRMSIAGDHQPQSDGTRELFPDQGLNILSEDVVYSDEVEILARA